MIDCHIILFGGIKGKGVGEMDRLSKIINAVDDTTLIIPSIDFERETMKAVIFSTLGKIQNKAIIEAYKKNNFKIVYNTISQQGLNELKSFYNETQSVINVLLKRGQTICS